MFNLLLEHNGNVVTFQKFAENFVDLWKSVGSSPQAIVACVLSVILMSIVYYLLFKLLKSAKATVIIILFAVFMVLGAFVFLFNVSKVSSSLYLIIPFGFVLFAAFVFAVEIKRVVWNKTFRGVKDNGKSSPQISDIVVRNNINEIIRALQNMSKNDVGALIVLSSGNIPVQVSESGSTVNASISSQLIESIFFPKTPLHDGAMIISGNKIESAGCFLPLTQNQNLPKELGTRHRAALGITEATAVTVFVVSEETGIISIVKDGKITRYADTEMLRDELNRYYAKVLERKEK